MPCVLNVIVRSYEPMLKLERENELYSLKPGFFLLFQIALLLSGLFLTLSLIFPKAVDWFMIFFFQYTSGN